MSVRGVHLEFEGRRAYFERAIAPLMDAVYRRGMGRAPAAPREDAGPVFKPASPQHFVQFASQVGERAARVEQRIMAFAFYLWNFEKRETFAEADVEAFFRTVHEAPPDDLPGRMAALDREKRFVEPSGTAGAWRLTSKGVNYVKNRLLAPA